MHILCTICSDLMNQAENIHVTKCGHVFHYQCLLHWISRSKSCPQCRNKVTEKCTYRLYLTISNESTGDDAATLQSRLDDAQLQLRQQNASFKEKEKLLEIKKNIALLESIESYANILNREMQRLKDENESLKNKVQTLSGALLESKESANSALKDQLEYVKILNREMQRLKDENKSLKNKVQTLSGALCESENKKNQTRDKLQMMQQQLTMEKSNNANLRNKIHILEEKLAKSRIKSDNAEGKRKSMTNNSRQIVKKMKITDDLNATVPNNDNNISIPSEFALLNSARNVTRKNEISSKTSTFHKKEAVQIPLSQENDPKQPVKSLVPK